MLRFEGQAEALADPLQYGLVHGRRHFPCPPLGVDYERQHLLAAFGVADGLERGTAIECRNALRYPVLEMLGDEVLHRCLDLRMLRQLFGLLLCGRLSRIEGRPIAEKFLERLDRIGSKSRCFRETRLDERAELERPACRVDLGDELAALNLEVP